MEGRAVGRGALRPDSAPARLDDTLCDCKPKPEAARLFSAAGLIGAVEAVKDMAQVLRVEKPLEGLVVNPFASRPDWTASWNGFGNAGGTTLENTLTPTESASELWKVRTCSRRARRRRRPEARCRPSGCCGCLRR